MDSIPKELYSEIFQYLSFKSRSEICSVSKLFEYYAIEVSKSKSIAKFYDSNYNSYNDPELWSDHERNNPYNINKIYVKHDYHLVVRLKQKHLVDLRDACVYNDIDLIELAIRMGQTDYNNGFNGACETNHYNIAKLMIIKGMRDWNDCLSSGCQYGRVDVVESAIKLGANDWNLGFSTACYGLDYTFSEIIEGYDNVEHQYYKYDKLGKFNDFQQIMILMILEGAISCDECYRPLHEHIACDWGKRLEWYEE